MEPDAVADPIAETLRFVQMTGIFYCPSVLSEPWGLELPPMQDCVWFHAVTQGICTVEVEGEERVLGPGDLILVPHGTGHRAWGRERTATPSVFDLPHEYYSEHYAVLRHGGGEAAARQTSGGGAEARVICGGIRFNHPAARHLVAALPSVIHTEASAPSRADWMRSTLELMAEETRVIRPGSEAVVSRLCDIVVIQAIRSWIERDPAAQTGWLGALRDPNIGAAIAAIHAEPARTWSVAGLAEAAAMSRSSFAAKFTESVGEPAMHYVTRWKMNVALELLRTSDATVAAAARHVGYDSEAAFSRAFKRAMGMSPASARKLAA